MLSASFLTVALVLGEFTIASLLNRTNVQVAINLLGKSSATHVGGGLAGRAAPRVRAAALLSLAGSARRPAAQPTELAVTAACT